MPPTDPDYSRLCVVPAVTTTEDGVTITVPKWHDEPRLQSWAGQMFDRAEISVHYSAYLTTAVGATMVPCEPGSQMFADSRRKPRHTDVVTLSNDRYSVESAGNTVRASCNRPRTRSISLVQSTISRRRIHVNPQKVERNVLPPGKSVTSRITHRRWTGGTALLSQRRDLLNEAEE